MVQLIDAKFADLLENPSQPRQQRNKVSDDLLTASIVQNGVLQPPAVRCVNGKYVIAWGHRRVYCGMKAGIVNGKVILLDRDMTEDECLVRMLTENAARSDLTAYDLCVSVEKVVAGHPEWSKSDIAQKVGVDPSAITHLLSASKVIPSVREALRDGQIGIKAVYEISKLPESEQEAMLALKLSGCSVEELARLGRTKRMAAEEEKAPRVGRLKCQMPGGATLSISSKSISLNEAIAVAQEWIRLAKSAWDQKVDFKTFERMCRDQAAAKAKPVTPAQPIGG